MPSGVDEATWNRAKGQAEKQGKGKNWAYVMSIYQSMSGEKKAALEETSPEIKPDDVMAPLSTPILKAIETLAKDDWYGFKLDKNKHDVDTMRVFSSSAYSGDSWTVPAPLTLLQAGKSIDWMTQPRDNIDGTAKTPEEKAVLKKWDPLIEREESWKKQWSRTDEEMKRCEEQGMNKTAILDGIRAMAKQAFTESDIASMEARNRRFSAFGRQGRQLPPGRGSQALATPANVARDIATRVPTPRPGGR